MAQGLAPRGCGCRVVAQGMVPRGLVPRGLGSGYRLTAPEPVGG